jgi:DNA-binding transcriptional LysR family regulator
MLGEQLERTQASLTTLNELAARLRSGIAGQLSICVIPAIAAALLPQVVARLHDMLPEVLLDIKVENSWRIVDLVETQQIDIGICSHFRTTTHVDAAPLLKLLMVCAVRDDDALARSASLQLTQLAGRPLALVEVFEGMAEIKSALSRSGVDEQVYCRVSTSALACELALRTRGAALVDNLTAMMYRARGLASVALPELPERSMALLRPALRAPSQFTDAFVSVLAEETDAIKAALAH